MIKMRAVPDDFDNVQALHSPYGAVGGLGTSMASTVDFNTSSYANQMMRPLMIDVRRAEAEDHLSPTGLSRTLENIGFTSSSAAAPSMSTSCILSPLSSTSIDGHHQHHNSYSGHHNLSGSMITPTTASEVMDSLSVGMSEPRTSSPYATTRHNSLDSTSLSETETGGGSTGSDHGSHSSHHMNSRYRIRQLQPLQPLLLRETGSRSRPDNLQSPLRSSMSWKGSSLDYSDYQGASILNPKLSGSSRPQQQQQLYQPEGLGNATPPTTLSPYSSSAYSGVSTWARDSAFPHTSLPVQRANGPGRLCRPISDTYGLSCNFSISEFAAADRLTVPLLITPVHRFSHTAIGP